jgi:hypothetical protein
MVPQYSEETCVVVSVQVVQVLRMSSALHDASHTSPNTIAVLTSKFTLFMD